VQHRQQGAHRYLVITVGVITNTTSDC
jgi:hypothetical protein